MSEWRGLEGYGGQGSRMWASTGTCTQVVALPSLETSQSWLDGSLGNPIPLQSPFRACLLSLELAGSESHAPGILCRLLLKASKIFLPVKSGGADAAVGRRRSRSLEKVTPRLQFPNKCEGTGCLNTLQLKHSVLAVNGVCRKTAFSLPIQGELEGEIS